MTNYIKVSKDTEIFFPFNTENDAVDMVWINDQTNNQYELTLMKASVSNSRGFSCIVNVTGIVAEPLFSYKDIYTTILNIPIGNYTVKCTDINNVERFVMIHISNVTDSSVYEQKINNIVYNG